ncbi:MAG: hypothetical protein JST37_12990 [Bacteroidetes bacterium]|jgi:hypothetical protein|nr:hypothetical protein [Bacteroidota bacterium]MBS1982276.1 hypothetical protein [Bacteroidota bacterium]
MEEKISIRAIDLYSNLFASKLADSFFEKKEKISGQEILSLCEIKQVNLFVVKELMNKWNQESAKWQSSFFNYDAPEVRESMNQFRNALSNHILISKNDFLPLLKTAVSQTLQVLFAPYDFYSNVLDARGNGLLKIDHLKNETRYLRINKAPLDKLVEKLNERKAELITGNEAFALLDHILEEVNFSPEDIDGYVVAFSKLTPLNVAGLFESKSEPLKAAVSKPAEQKPQPANEGLSKNEFQIKDALTINQKFMFTKMLFSGDFELFTQAIEQLDKLGSANEAVVYLNKNYPHWDKESDEYEEFFAVVQRKFGS